MRILVTGARGMLGFDLCNLLRSKGHEVIEWDLPEHDITNVTPTIAEAVKLKPKTVYHLAAYTDVDACEEKRADAYRVNTIGAWTAALAARDAGADLVYISTDYVFDGAKGAPYLENDKTHPLNYYGVTKLLGEQAVARDVRRLFIIRSSWLFGAHGRNFVDTIINLARDKDSIDVVDDQRGCPTFTNDLAQALVLLPGRREFGTYHVANSGICTWYEFAREIVRLTGMKTIVHPTTSDKYIRPAKRPAYSALDTGLFAMKFRHTLRPWQDALKDYLGQRKLLRGQ